ncbi:MAG: Membrane protein insertase YidC [Candidatus Omnitrophica bacterium]|nr:Membrane protein insertase YidC [Candidatus Omnitrophota bacterium]
MEKRTILALVLSFAVLGFYPTILGFFYPDYGKTPATVVADSAPPAAPGAPQAAGVPSAPPRLAAPSSKLELAQDVRVKTRELDLAFHPQGGILREVSSTAYRDAETRLPLGLISVQDDAWAPLAVFFYGVPALENVDARYRVESEGQTVRMSADLAGTLAVSKTVTLGDSGDRGTFTLRLTNTGPAPLDLAYELVTGPSLLPHNSIDAQYLEANFYDAGTSKLQHLKETKDGKQKTSEGASDWGVTKSRHFSLILRSDTSGARHTGLVRGLGRDRFAVSMVAPKTRLEPGATLERSYTLYIGPNDINRLQPMGLGAVVNFGKLDWIGKLLVGGLELIHGVVRNYGAAVILLTLLINLVLFPLTRASYMSMKRMQLVQPQMNKLREKYKSEPEKLNKEMMELYRKHKVNPFGGCLPMLAQMPVFIALYVALSKTVGLRNSEFLWIKDLSSPDIVKLPFSLIFIGDTVHVLPIIMAVAALIQQKFTMVKIEGQDPAMEAQQKMMAVMMPLLFLFMFYSMPAGLVLYWLTNTVVMALYQYRLKNLTLS